jgi:hypothetical protein
MSWNVTLRPTSDASPNNLRVKDGHAYPHYTCVNEESPDDGTLYLYQAYSSLGEYEAFGMENPTRNGVVRSLTLYNRARASGATDGRVAPTIWISGTKYGYTDVQTLTTSWADYYKAWTTNPATGAPWTWDDIDSLIIGSRLYCDSANYAYLTQVYAVLLCENSSHPRAQLIGPW